VNLPKGSEGGDDTTFSVDQKVEARYAGGPKFYPGSITELQTNGKGEMVTCSVHYDDGEDEGSSFHFFLSTVRPRDVSSSCYISRGSQTACTNRRTKNP
jgi:hypothetical protein